MINDSLKMQHKFGMLDKPLTRQQLAFRIFGLQDEELTELMEAYNSNDPEELVDALVDTIVIALGTLHLCGVDVQKAWDEVHKANMSKVRGTKPGREQSGGFDLIKPKNWKAPSHKGNHGILDGLLN